MTCCSTHLPVLLQLLPGEGQEKKGGNGETPYSGESQDDHRQEVCVQYRRCKYYLVKTSGGGGKTKRE